MTQLKWNFLILFFCLYSRHNIFHKCTGCCCCFVFSRTFSGYILCAWCVWRVDFFLHILHLANVILCTHTQTHRWLKLDDLTSILNIILLSSVPWKAGPFQWIICRLYSLICFFCHEVKFDLIFYDNFSHSCRFVWKKIIITVWLWKVKFYERDNPGQWLVCNDHYRRHRRQQCFFCLSKHGRRKQVFFQLRSQISI